MDDLKRISECTLKITWRLFIVKLFKLVENLFPRIVFGRFHPANDVCFSLTCKPLTIRVVQLAVSNLLYSKMMTFPNLLSWLILIFVSKEPYSEYDIQTLNWIWNKRLPYLSCRLSHFNVTKWDQHQAMSHGSWLINEKHNYSHNIE